MTLLLRLLTGLALVGTVLLVAGIWQAWRTPVVVEVTLPLPGLPSGTRIRALHLSDTHGGPPEMPRERLERIVAQANALTPDIILLTGDYHLSKLSVFGTQRLEDSLEPLAALRAPLGVYASMGNHDTERWTSLVMGRKPWPKLLVDSHVMAGPLAVAAINSAAFRPNINAALADIPPGTPTLLLAHEGDQFQWRPVPDLLRPLVLAGHTHGGQVRLPLGIYPGDVKFGTPLCRRGLCTINGWRVFVSSGVGNTFVPYRLGVPPEMVLITLVAEADLPPGQDSGRNSGTDR
jgi:predicted MPP superfamily phosphohydrolase